MQMGRLKVAVPEERKLGERCCDPGARPTVGVKAAGRLAEDLAVLGHPVRLQLLNVLAHSAGKVCVCDLEAAVPVKQPTVSHHLRLLREAGLVESERRGLWAYYYVRREALDRLRQRIGNGLSELS